jgi:hypothetical protein
MNLKNSKKIFLIFSVILLFIINVNLFPMIKDSYHLIFNAQNRQAHFMVVFLNEIGDIEPLIPDNARISFISSVETKHVFETDDSVRDFYIVQFLVAPHILDNNLDNEYAIGIFTPESLNNSNYEKFNFEILKSTPGGLYLFKRKSVL